MTKKKPAHTFKVGKTYQSIYGFDRLSTRKWKCVWRDSKRVDLETGKGRSKKTFTLVKVGSKCGSEYADVYAFDSLTGHRVVAAPLT